MGFFWLSFLGCSAGVFFGLLWNYCVVELIDRYRHRHCRQGRFVLVKFTGGKRKQALPHLRPAYVLKEWANETEVCFVIPRGWQTPRHYWAHKSSIVDGEAQQRELDELKKMMGAGQ